MKLKRSPLVLLCFVATLTFTSCDQSRADKISVDGKIDSTEDKKTVLPSGRTESAQHGSQESSTEVGEVSFARRTFEAMTRGDDSVAAKFDWAGFIFLGENFGEYYRGLSTQAEKDKATSGFITSFANGFRSSGGTVDRYTNWRVTVKDATKTEVTADSQGVVLKIVVVKREGVEKVSSLNIVK